MYRVGLALLLLILTAACQPVTSRLVTPPATSALAATPLETATNPPGESPTATSQAAPSPSPTPFQPPDAAQRQAALGDLSRLAQEQQAWFSSQNFQPIPAPGAEDWLANHDESGQTFDEFIASKPNLPGPGRHTLYFQPLGQFSQDAPSLDLLREFAAVFFQLRVKIQPTQSLQSLKVHQRINKYTHKPQLLTGDVHTYLKTRLPKDAYCRLGITMVDLYPEDDWNYLFGQASLTDQVGVYSFARYDPRFFGEPRPDDWHRLLLQRSCHILAHETGHIFGLDHCIYYHCLMNGTNSLRELDSQPLFLCPICLRKLQSSIGFDVPRRQRGLEEFCGRAHLDSRSAAK